MVTRVVEHDDKVELGEEKRADRIRSELLGAVQTKAKSSKKALGVENTGKTSGVRSGRMKRKQLDTSLESFARYTRKEISFRELQEFQAEGL